MNTNEEFLQTILKSIQESNDKQTKELKTYINKEIDEIKRTIKQENQRITDLEEKYTALEVKYNNLEKRLKKNNIIIFGLNYDKGDLLEYTIERLNTHLEINIQRNDINNIYTIGKKTENKPIIVQFTSYLQKYNVLKNCRKLKETQISISEDLTLEERGELKILKQHLNKAKLENFKSFIRGRKLYINGKTYTAQQLLDSEGEINKENVNIETKTKGSEIVINLPGSATSIPDEEETDEYVEEEANIKKEKCILLIEILEKTRSLNRFRTQKSVQ